MATFGQRLKELRNEKGLKQDELAKEIGTTFGTVSKWERDIRKPEFEKLNRLCDYFQVSLAYILGEDTDRSYVPPIEDTLAEWEDDVAEEDLIRMVRMLTRISLPSLEIVRATITQAYKTDKREGTLRRAKENSEEYAGLVMQAADEMDKSGLDV